MKHLILKTACTTPQVLVLLATSLFAFFHGSEAVIWLFQNYTGQIEYSPINLWDIAYLLLFFISIALFLILFLKEGISLGDKKVNSSYFLFGKLIKSKNINLKGACDICMLRFNMVYKTEVEEIGDVPLVIDRFKVYRVYALNRTHTKRMLIFKSRSVEKSKEIRKELSSVLGLNYVPYSPPRSIGRRK